MKKSSDKKCGTLSKLYLAIVTLFLYIPIFVMIVFSFNTTKSRSVMSGFTLDWYVRLFHNELILKSLGNTVIIAVCASVAATVLGTLAAIGISRMGKHSKAAVMQVTNIPIVNPEIVTGVSLMLLFVFFQARMNLEFGFVTLIIAHITFGVPYVVLNVMPKFRQMQPNIYEAAQDLGCGPVKSFFKAVMPEIMPGVLSGFMMSFTFSLDDFVISYFTSGATSQTLPITIYSMTRRKVSPEINALSTIIFVIVLIVLVAKNIIERRRANTKRLNAYEEKHLSAAKRRIIKRVAVSAVAVCLVIGMTILTLGGFDTDVPDELTVDDPEYYTALKGQDVTINVYNWGEYVPTGEDGTIDINSEFTKLTGIKINYSTYATNEELYAKLRAGAASYDVIIPSDYMISRMIKEDMLQPLDFDNIPNYKYIMDKFKSPEYDSDAKYSIPYTWGTVGIVYNSELTDLSEDEIDWDVFWNSDYADNVLMFDNPRDAFAIAQSLLGQSMNTEDKKELRAAADKLKEQKKNVQAYVMDEIFDKMGAGEAAFAPYYAGDAITMMEDNESLGFVLPKSGTNLFIDAMCIPKCAKQKQAAEMYINFMCEPETALAVAEYLGYSTPNSGTYELLDDEIKEDGISYPDDEFLNERCETFRNLSDEANRYMQDLWTEIKSSN